VENIHYIPHTHEKSDASQDSSELDIRYVPFPQNRNTHESEEVIENIHYDPHDRQSEDSSSYISIHFTCEEQVEEVHFSDDNFDSVTPEDEVSTDMKKVMSVAASGKQWS